MRKLTFILLVLFTGNTAYSQAIAAHATATTNAPFPPNRLEEPISVAPPSKKEEAAKDDLDVAKEAKRQAKSLKQEQKEAAKALELPEAGPSTLATQTTSMTQEAGEVLASVQGNGQDKDKKAKKESSKEITSGKTQHEQDNHGRQVKATASGASKNGQEVKEVASAKRQQKPEKVEGSVNGNVKAPRSAARPGRGAARAVQGTSNSAAKTVGNAAKAAKPVKVGGKVGIGSVIKAGKN